MFHVKQRLGPKDEMRLEDFEAATRNRLKGYVRLLDKWKGVTNLISVSAFDEIWSRHIPDAARLVELFPNRIRWLDFGSGAGLPSVIIGAILAERPGARVYCVESDGRKCAFLRNVARELELPVKVMNTRVETLEADLVAPIEMVTARAFSSIRHILSLADPFLIQDATLILPRGEASRSEIEGVDPIRYDLIEHDGLAGSSGFFLEIRRRAGKS